MNTLSARTSALVLGAGGLFLATASEAQMPVAPLKSEMAFTRSPKDAVRADGAVSADGAVVRATDGASLATIGTQREGPVPANQRAAYFAELVGEVSELHGAVPMLRAEAVNSPPRPQRLTQTPSTKCRWDFAMNLDCGR